MSFLVIYPKPNETCLLCIHTDDTMVPTNTLTWYLAHPGLMTPVQRKIKKLYIGGMMHGKGALYGASQAEIADLVATILGPSVETCRSEAGSRKTPWLLILFTGLVGFLLTVIWLGLKTLMLIALIPVLLFFISRRMR